MTDENKIMDAKELFELYRGAMAFVEVELPNGDVSIGSAFHIGDGVFITARHVIENVKIKSLGTTERYYVPDPNGNTTIHGDDSTKYRSVFAQSLTLKSGPFFHPNPKVDVAAFVIEKADVAAVPLGGHLDDWIRDSDFVMVETLMMGYPPIPFSQHPILVAARGEVNAVVDKYNGPHPHFIVSALPRGGFSGGLCLIKWGFALGVIVESLTTNNKETELGFMSVLTVEPIYSLLEHHGITPSDQMKWGTV